MSREFKNLLYENLNDKPWENELIAINAFKDVKTRGWLNKSELVIACNWKSPRARKHILNNHPNTIKSITQKAFSMNEDEIEKVSLLTQLNGVSIPMASAILMLTNPKVYGVIDIRAWKLLYEFDLVSSNPGGQNFSISEWIEYLNVIRSLADIHNVTCRDIDRTLYSIHQKRQQGRLYT